MPDVLDATYRYEDRGITHWCSIGRHDRCAHRIGGPAHGGVIYPHSYVTMPNRQPGRTDDAPWIPRWPNGVDVALVEPCRLWRCPCDCHQAGQLDLFEATA